MPSSFRPANMETDYTVQLPMFLSSMADFDRTVCVHCMACIRLHSIPVSSQNAFPARFKGVYITNQPWYISAILSLLRPFLSEKMNSRVSLTKETVIVPILRKTFPNLPIEVFFLKVYLRRVRQSYI